MRILTSLLALLFCVPAALRGQTTCLTPWSLEEVLRIGFRESRDLIGNINDLAVGPDSVLYVAQAMVPAVKVFSLDGQFLREIGRAGQGPGDISGAASGVGWIGDTLWIADRRRIQLFTTSERVPDEVIQFTMPRPEEGTRLTPGRMLADGTLVAGRRSITDWRAWLTATSLPLRRVSRSGEVIDTLAIVDWSSNAVEYEADPGRPWLAIHPLKDLPTQGLNEYLTALRPDGSAVVQVAKVNEDGTPPSFDILVISIGGDTLLHRAVEYEPREVTSAMESPCGRIRGNGGRGSHQPILASPHERNGALAPTQCGSQRVLGSGIPSSGQGGSSRSGWDYLVATRDAWGPCRYVGDLRFGWNAGRYSRDWGRSQFAGSLGSPSRDRPREPSGSLGCHV